MSDAPNTKQNEKAAKIRRKPERESVLAPTFAAARKTITDNRNQSQPSRNNLLQRQCRCGKHTTVGGTCEECQRKEEINTNLVPDDLSHTSPNLQTSRERKTSFNLSTIPAHTHTTTIGNNFAFGDGAYQPGAKTGHHLLTYELAHVVQQTAVRAARLQRAGDEEEAKGSPATPTATAEATDGAIEALDLTATAKAAAQDLKKKRPEISFTSGRRNVSDQARAMASNIVSSSDRKWIEKTYVSASALQKWVDDNPKAVTVDDIATGLEKTLNEMPEADRGKISKHLSGEAFDVQPQDKDAEAIKTDIRGLSGLSKFLENEGGLVRWHAQFKKANDFPTSNDPFEQEADRMADQVMATPVQRQTLDDNEKKGQLKQVVGTADDQYKQDADYVANEVVGERTSKALLDMYKRGSTPDRTVQRLVQPIVTSAPPRTISIRDFITLVEAEEAKWPAPEQTQTALMITRLRKIFYGLPGWDKYLIPGASGIASGYNISEEETGRENLSLVGPDADIVRSRQVVRGASGTSPAIASQQEVRLEDGTFADIGHVFAGLDAANHPTSISAGFGIASVADNKAAVTWTGDLGSAVSEIMFSALNAGVPTTAGRMQAIVNEYASAQDMLGNIDAYVIADQYNITNAGGRKVSELLRAYYLSAASTSDGRAREHRYSRFCALTGLTGWTGGGFANEVAWLDRWTPEVAGAAALYFGANTAGVLAMPGRAGAISAIQSRTNPLARLLLQNYLDALKIRVAAESP